MNVIEDYKPTVSFRRPRINPENQQETPIFWLCEVGPFMTGPGTQQYRMMSGIGRTMPEAMKRAADAWAAFEEERTKAQEGRG